MGRTPKEWELGTLKPNSATQFNRYPLVVRISYKEDKFLNNHSAVEKFSTLRCEKCGMEKPIEELAGINYPERKKNGGFRFREIRVYKRGLEMD